MEDISFRKILDVFNSVGSTRSRQDETQRLVEEFRTKPFEELRSRVNEKQRQADQRIGQLLSVLDLSKDAYPVTTANGTTKVHLTPTTNGPSRIPTDSFNYPELFTY